MNSTRRAHGWAFTVFALSLTLTCRASFARADDPAPDCSRPALSLPDPGRPAGAPDPNIPIQHILVAIEENHSFDNYFGQLNSPAYYGSEVDGLTPDIGNYDAHGAWRPAYRLPHYCSVSMDHSWNGSHNDWDYGLNDGFVIVNQCTKHGGVDALGYYGPDDLPYYYALANEYAIADRYFASVLGPSDPNHFFALTGSSHGQIDQGFLVRKHLTTIFDRLNEQHISWKYYASNFPVLALIPQELFKYLGHIHTIAQYKRDARQGKLPSVAFLAPSFLLGDEHPPRDVQVGQERVAGWISDLMRSPEWKSSALFLTYDDPGGFHDHVPPPRACDPGDEAPHLKSDSFPDGFDRYGFRVPFVAVSPYAKHHFVSHVVYDHTSMLKFIETKFNLPALTRRDANADGLLDLFDFSRARTEVPRLPKATVDTHDELWCLFHRG